jgi:hypothetical protein
MADVFIIVKKEKQSEHPATEKEYNASHCILYNITLD